MAGVSEIDGGEGTRAGLESFRDAVRRRRSGSVSGCGTFGVEGTQREGVAALFELEREIDLASCGAVLDREQEPFVVSSEVEIGVSPGVELGASPERLAGAQVGCAFFRVMDEDDGERVAALKLAEKGEQRGDLGGEVLVDAMEPDERIEDEQAGAEHLDGADEPLPIELGVDPERRLGDDVEIEAVEIGAGGLTDSFEAPSEDVVGVFGGEDENGPDPVDGEAAERGSTGGDGDGEIEGEKRLAALRFASDDPDGLLGPEIPNEPPRLVGHGREAMGRQVRKRPAHDRAPAGLRALALGVGVTSSK